MPFYIRARQQDIPTPTISTVASDDEDNFLTDPEKFFDELPQPFRLINKVVNEVIESAWEKISLQQWERELEAKKVRPPSYVPSSTLENFKNVSCMCITDTDVMFLALENSLVAIHKDTHEEINTWYPEEPVNVDRLSCVFDDTYKVYLLSAIDDMGFARLLIYETETFHFVCTLNELVEGAPKSSATKFIISDDAQFCGVTLESNNVSSLDFYKLPIDNWSKEIEAGRKEFLKKAESLTTATTSDVSVESKTPHVSSSEILFPPIKFSAVTPVLKVNEPQAVTGISGKTPQQTLDQVSTEVIGDGTCHIFSENALNIEKQLFETLNERELVFADEDSTPNVHRPTFYFMKKSRLEPPLQFKSDATYSYLAVWWTNHHNFYVYQLGKPGKSLDFKADVVWPQSSNITCCETASDSELLAIGLDNGSVTLWDRSLGLVKCISMISHNIPITSINFLHPETGKQQQFQQDVRLLIGCANGQISELVCDQNPRAQCIVNALPLKEDKFAFIRPLPNLPQAFMFVKTDGSMMLRSTEKDAVLCNILLPDDNQCEPPFDVTCSLDPKGEILFIRGSTLASSDDGCVFIFHLRSFPTLDKLRRSQGVEKDESVSPASFTDTIQSLITQRMKKQSARTDVLSARWHNLDKQLEFVLNLRETMAVAKRDHHFSRSSTPASHWSRTTSRIIRHNKDLQKV